MFRHQLEKEAIYGRYNLSPLEQNMADAYLSSSLDNFGPESCFFGMQALPKNRGAYVDDQNWQTVQTGQTGMHKPV